MHSYDSRGICHPDGKTGLQSSQEMALNGDVNAQHPSPPVIGLLTFHDGDNEDKARENKYNREIHRVHVQIAKRRD